MTVIALAALVAGVRAHQVGGGLLAFGVVAIAAAYPTLYAFGCSRAGLLVTDQAVVVRNPLKKWEIPVTEVRRFVAGTQPAWQGNPTPGVLVELNDGSARPIWTFAKEGFVWNTRKNTAPFNPLAEELNALLAGNPTGEHS